MTINAYYMNKNLKNGWDAHDFATDLGIEKNEFLSMLEKTFVSRTLNGFRRKLTVNASYKKRKNKSHPKKVKDEENDIATIEAIPEDSNDNSAKQSTPNSSLDELEEMRKSISSQLCQMEAKIITSKGKKKAAFDKLAAEESWISKIIEELNAHKKKAEAIVAAISSANEEIGQLKDHKKVLRDQLSQIEASIQATRKVTIYAVSQEETVIESESDMPEYDATYDTEIFNKIVASDLSETSTVKQLKYVASLIEYCHKLSDLKRNYEIIFDNQTSEKLFFEFL